MKKIIILFIGVLLTGLMLSCSNPSREEVRLAFILDKQAGISIINGINIAVEELNKTSDKLYRVNYFDNEGSRLKTRAMFQKAMKLKPHVALTLFSNAALELTDLVTTEKIPLVAFAASVSEFTVGNPYNFRYFISIEDEVAVLIRQLEKLAIRHICVLAQDDAYGKEFIKVIRQKASALNIIFCHQFFSETGADFTQIIAKANKEPALYIAGFTANLKQLLEVAHNKNYKGRIFGTSTMSMPEIVADFQAHGVYICAPQIYNPNFLPVQQIKNTFESRFQMPFNHYAASGYDFMYILNNLMMGKQVTRETIRQELTSGFVHTGVFGVLNVEKGAHDFFFPVMDARILNGSLIFQ